MKHNLSRFIIAMALAMIATPNTYPGDVVPVSPIATEIADIARNCVVIEALDISEYDKFTLYARKEMAASNWKEAFILLNKALAMEPKRPEAYIYYSLALTIRKEYPSAEQALLKGMEAAPTSAVLRYEYARLMVIKGDTAKALEAANKAVELDQGKSWKFLKLQARLLKDSGEKTAAIDAYNKAITIVKNSLHSTELMISRAQSGTSLENIRHETEMRMNADGKLVEETVAYRDTRPNDAPEEMHADARKLKNDIAALETALAELTKA